MTTLTSALLKAIEQSPQGISTLDFLKSLGLSDEQTLKTLLSRLQKAHQIVRLKRGVYAHVPLQDSFAAAQATFSGYLGLSTALYLHKFISEVPFTLFVITRATSAVKKIGISEFRAVALRQRAIGFEQKGSYVLSTPAKTLFDCLILPQYALEEEKLITVFQGAGLTPREWKEFDWYVKKFLPLSKKNQAYAIKKKILSWRKNYGN